MRYFGTDGIRGRVGESLTPRLAYEVGRFFSWFLRETLGHPPKVLVARDTRISGQMLEGALSAGLMASGGDVFLLGVAPTPTLAYLTKTEGFDFGVMLSASHNPYFDNGIKLFERGGEKPLDELLSLAEDYLDGRLLWKGESLLALPYATGDEIGRCYEARGLLDTYVQHLTELGLPEMRGIHIGVDPANGATAEIAERVYRALGIEVTWIHNHPDGVNINAACGSTHMAEISRLVRERGLMAGFAFDGDGDRCLATDEGGEILDGDAILYLGATHMKGQGTLTHNTVVASVMSNGGLATALEGQGISLVRTKVGDRHIREEMVRGGYALGGEQSGHILFAPLTHTGDGLLTSLVLLSYLVDAPLSEQVQGLQYLPQVMLNVPLGKRGILQDPNLRAAIQEGKQLLGEGGRLLVRESGTEPLLRIMVEGRDAHLCHVVAEEMRATIEESERLCAES